jgi:hypothetical protein
MSGEHTPNGWKPADEEFEQPLLSTEEKGQLIPPPRKPPTAIGAAASEPEPRPPRPARGWGRPTVGSGGSVPRAVSQAVDAVLDVLDSIADTVRSWGTRGA